MLMWGVMDSWYSKRLPDIVPRAQRFTASTLIHSPLKLGQVAHPYSIPFSGTLKLPLHCWRNEVVILETKNMAVEREQVRTMRRISQLCTQTSSIRCRRLLDSSSRYLKSDCCFCRRKFILRRLVDDADLGTTVWLPMVLPLVNHVRYQRDTSLFVQRLWLLLVRSVCSWRKTINPNPSFS